MTKESFKRGFVSAAPLIALIILCVFRVYVVDTFIQCVQGGAGCKPAVIENVLPPDKAATLLTDDTNLLRENNAGNRTLQATRYGGRITWVFFVLTFMLLSLVALGVAVGLIYKIFSDWNKRPYLSVTITLAISAVIGFTLYKNPETYMTTLKALLEHTVQVDMTNIVAVTNLVNSIGFALSFALVLASCAILLQPYNNSSSKGLKELSTRMNYLRTVLYVGTLLLVVGVLLMRAIFQWSLAFVPQTEVGAEKIAESFTSSIVSAEAGFYTLILAGVYLPAAFILQWRAGSLKGLPEQPSEKDKVLHGYGLTFSLTESLPRIIAILGPFLVGPVGDLLKHLPNQ
jgi:hypothetical protein